MMTHEKALRAAARAWLDTTGPGTDPLEDAIAAYISALLPEDTAGLVERLRESAEHLQEYVAEVGPWPSTYKHCASLIQS